MLRSIRPFLDETAPDLRARLIAIYGVLAVLNVGAWLWALVAFHDRPALLGIALVIYGLGLRHAVDADHIAAIDNVTRKLMQENERPVSVGFFFALGHSTIVIVVATAVAATASMLHSFESFHAIGGTISTGISALFLLAIAAMNILIFFSIYRSYRRVRAGGAYVAADLDLLLNNRGLLARLFRPLFRTVTRSWHMFLLGFLFGLGFDTATEIAMFGVSAAQAAKGLPIAAILVLPVLFAAGMSLVDTTDGALMLGAYEWAFVKPIRKLYYNMTITLVSVVVAVLIGGIEALGLIGDRFGLAGGFWGTVGALGDNFNGLGFAIIGIVLAAWAFSYLLYRWKGLDELEVRRPGPI
jgi:high-affinity nickel-transport protein